MGLLRCGQKYLYQRGGCYYFWMKVPKDLRPLFPSPWLKRSLRTDDIKIAKNLLSNHTGKAKSVFSLLRSGILNDEQIITAVSSLFPEKPTNTKEVRHKLLSEVFTLYVAELSPNWTSKSKQEFEKQFEVMLAILKDARIDGYDHESCLSCRATLLDRKLHPKTVNKYIGLLSTVFKWAIKRKYAKDNPAEGLMLKISKRADEERKAYDLQDLQRVAANLPVEATEPWKYWVPLIAMYSGMRREEICQLRADDITEFNSIWCFNIVESGEDISLKTEASTRIVPIHPILLELGFLQYVQSRPKGNIWGFTPWKGQYGKKFGNWYSQSFNRIYVTDDPQKSFHSFRHTVSDTLKQAGVQEVVIAEILGHKNDSITTGRYGKRYNPTLLLNTLTILNFDVNLSIVITNGLS